MMRFLLLRSSAVAFFLLGLTPASGTTIKAVRVETIPLNIASVDLSVSVEVDQQFEWPISAPVSDVQTVLEGIVGPMNSGTSIASIASTIHDAMNAQIYEQTFFLTGSDLTLRKLYVKSTRSGTEIVAAVKVGSAVARPDPRQNRITTWKKHSGWKRKTKYWDSVASERRSPSAAELAQLRQLLNSKIDETLIANPEPSKLQAA